MPYANGAQHPASLLQFYHTDVYPCSYLSGKQSISLVATPPELVDAEIYGVLLRNGFRRSGVFAYRPDCPQCHACVPVRLPVDRFMPNRSQRRSQKTHAGLVACEAALDFDEAHYSLYKRYQSARHPGGGMDKDSHEQYSSFLLQSSVDSRLFEFSENGILRMVSVVDVVNDGLSAVYTFFDPDLPGSSFGTYAILWQIAQCAANDLPYLYLGYWIGACDKMAYKAAFQPIEGLIDGAWQEFAPPNAAIKSSAATG